jgi:hypothetical protein
VGVGEREPDRHYHECVGYPIDRLIVRQYQPDRVAQQSVAEIDDLSDPAILDIRKHSIHEVP